MAALHQYDTRTHTHTRWITTNSSLFSFRPTETSLELSEKFPWGFNEWRLFCGLRAACLRVPVDSFKEVNNSQEYLGAAPNPGALTLERVATSGQDESWTNAWGRVSVSLYPVELWRLKWRSISNAVQTKPLLKTLKCALTGCSCFLVICPEMLFCSPRL